MGRYPATRPRGTAVRRTGRGLAAAALILALAVPSTALADPITLELERTFNNNDNHDKAFPAASNVSVNKLASEQEAELEQEQPSVQAAKVVQPAENDADIDVRSYAVSAARSGDAKAVGSFAIVGVKSDQYGNASANGKAANISATGDANGTATGASSANGGNALLGVRQSTGAGGKSLTVATAGAAGSRGNGHNGHNGDNGGDDDDDNGHASGNANTNGGAGGAGGNSNAAANGSTGGDSGANTSTGNTSTGGPGGTAGNFALGGQTGNIKSTAIVAGGNVANVLKVDANTQGTGTATSGNPTISAPPSAGNTVNTDQSANPSSELTQDNHPTMRGRQDLLTDQHPTTETQTANPMQNTSATPK